MSAEIVDGNAIATSILETIQSRLESENLTPGLVDVVIGGDEMAHKYVDIKGKTARKLNFSFEKKAYPENFNPSDINSYIQDKNGDSAVHGIIVQLPLPETIIRHKLLKSVHPFKDVDALHPKNLGYLIEGSPVFLSPVILAVMDIIRSTKQYDETNIEYLEEELILPDIEGTHACILGSGLLVGRPLSAFLMTRGATISVINEHTKNATELTKHADIVITGTNQKDVLQPDEVKEGSIVIDVGNDIESSKFENKDIFLSKTPGGVGPITVAHLLRNTFLSALYLH